MVSNSWADRIRSSIIAASTPVSTMTFTCWPPTGGGIRVTRESISTPDLSLISRMRGWICVYGGTLFQACSVLYSFICRPYLCSVGITKSVMQIGRLAR